MRREVRRCRRPPWVVRWLANVVDRIVFSRYLSLHSVDSRLVSIIRRPESGVQPQVAPASHYSNQRIGVSSKGDAMRIRPSIRFMTGVLIAAAISAPVRAADDPDQHRAAVSIDLPDCLNGAYVTYDLQQYSYEYWWTFDNSTATAEYPANCGPSGCPFESQWLPDNPGSPPGVIRFTIAWWYTGDGPAPPETIPHITGGGCF
jgi:hypothetical protein